MFGYVTPCRHELKVWEDTAYQSAYCGLCWAMGKRHGFPARMLLNYDFVFLTLLLTPGGERPETVARRCPARLYCGKRACLKPSDGLDTAADESTVLAYWKLQDTAADAPFWKRLGVRLALRLLTPAYRKAAAAVPEFNALTVTGLQALRVLEETDCASLDRPADAFACILKAAAPSTGDETRDRAMEQLLYHVGRWIYLLDAWDDLAEDKARDNYNPILARYGEKAEEHREEIRLTLRHSRNLAISACMLLETGAWQGLVENILFQGLESMEEQVFSGQRRKKSRLRHRRVHS